MFNPAAAGLRSSVIRSAVFSPFCCLINPPGGHRLIVAAVFSSSATLSVTVISAGFNFRIHPLRPPKHSALGKLVAPFPSPAGCHPEQGGLSRAQRPSPSTWPPSGPPHGCFFFRRLLWTLRLVACCDGAASSHCCHRPTSVSAAMPEMLVEAQVTASVGYRRAPRSVPTPVSSRFPQRPRRRTQLW